MVKADSATCSNVFSYGKPLIRVKESFVGKHKGSLNNPFIGHFSQRQNVAQCAMDVQAASLRLKSQ